MLHLSPGIEICNVEQQLMPVKKLADPSSVCPPKTFHIKTKYHKDPTVALVLAHAKHSPGQFGPLDVVFNRLGTFFVHLKRGPLFQFSVNLAHFGASSAHFQISGSNHEHPLPCSVATSHIGSPWTVFSHYLCGQKVPTEICFFFADYRGWVLLGGVWLVTAW